MLDLMPVCRTKLLSSHQVLRDPSHAACGAIYKSKACQVRRESASRSGPGVGERTFAGIANAPAGLPSSRTTPPLVLMDEE